MGLGQSFGGHERSTVLGETDEWLTPLAIIESLGSFDLDPATPRTMPWETATRRFTIDDDGLAQPWEGRVWLNPPYGRAAVQWLERLADHGDGIALIFARTDTSWFTEAVWRRADAVLFLKGRLRFYRTDGQQITRERSGGAGAGAPSVLVAYGERNVEALRSSGLVGHFVALDRREAAHG